MGAGRLITGWALASGLAMAAPAQQLRIQYAEPVEISTSPGNTQFDAYGRRFSLVLETNDRFLKSLPAARKATLGTIRLLRGTVSGAPNSWVRLATDGSEVAGAIWDGTDLYIVARHDQVAPHLAQSLEVNGLQTVVYRLSDTENVLPANFCATQPAVGTGKSQSGLTQFKALVGELKLRFVKAPTDELDISLIADATLQERYSSPNDNLTLSMLNTLNVVDGIYDEQLGLMINASDLRMAPVTADPFTATDASAMLAQLKTFRSSIPEVEAKAVAHLLTGRVFETGTLGIAVIGGACSALNGVSLTSAGNGAISLTASLVMAHEIGHNLGAEHDTTSCGDTFLMWPEYSWHTTPMFSQCSLDQLRPFIAAHRGSCIVSPSWGDVSVRVGAIANPLRTEPFVWPVYVRSEGTAAALDTVLSFNIPSDLMINGVTPTQGSCAPLNGNLYCQLGTLPAGAEARVDLNLTTNWAEPEQLRAYVDASNDRYDTNNQAIGNIDVQPQAKLGMTLTPSTAAALVGETVPYTLTITSNGARDARNVTLSLGGGGYLQIESAVPTQGTCYTHSCTLGDIPTGSSAQVTIHARATQGGLLNLSVQLNSGNAALYPQYLNATLDATASFDLAIDAGPPYRTIAAGVPYEFVIPVRANGTRPVVGGLFRMNTAGGTFLSADIDGTSCAREELVVAQGGGCPLGTLNPGEQKIVRVRLQFNEVRDTGVYVTADILNDELWSNNSASLTLNVRVVTDVSILPPSPYAGDTEGRNFQAIATLRSQGANDAANVSATFDVPVGVRILSATLPQGACTLTGDRRVTCTRPTLALTEQPQMTVTLVGDEPAQYTGIFAVTADNDGVPSNNSAPLAIYVGPLTDVTLNPIPALPGFIVGQPREFTVEVVTKLTRPAENVVVSFPATQSIVLEAISTPVGTCDVSGFSPHCNLGTLPPNSLVRLTPRYRAVTAGASMSGWISVQANRDVDQSNNSRSVYMNAYEAGDIEIRVASASSVGTAGSTLVLPRITLNTIIRSQDVRIDIPIPAFATVETISFAAGVCTGTTTLQCYMFDRATGSSDALDVTLRLNSAGTFTSDIQVRAGNDTNAANDTATLQIRANAASGSSSGSSSSSSGGSAGGGGGGGRLEWGLLAALGLMAARRARRRAALHA